MEEIRKEQLRNIEMKERRPQRLAPLYQRNEGNVSNNTPGDDNIGEGLQDNERQDYIENQIEGVNDEISPTGNVDDIPMENVQREPS